ncbi:MAG: hypothetical protein GX802_04165 [Clostridiales bacterium]|nr:hypothetical protein [Clostridiales bacterium]
MKNKKLAIMIASLVLIASLVIGGTIAYLTDSDTATNTITVGDVEIGLEEPNWDDTTDGKDLVPGDTMVKDPIVTALEGESYMRVVLSFYDTATNSLITDTDRIALILETIYFDATYDVATQTPGTGIVAGTSYSLADLAAFAQVNPDFTFDTTRVADAGIRYYNYNGIFSTANGDETVLFTNLVIPTDYTSADVELLGNFEIRIVAEAIQATNFADATAAFIALDAA